MDGTPPDPRDAASPAVDVIVPVHGAAAAFGRCVASLERHTDLTRHRLLVVADGPQAASGEAILDRLAEAAGAAVLRQPERRGFVAAANRGMAFSERDVVLLNSDTEVTAGWLDKLARAAYSAPEVGTATPFSNSATICSLPRWLEENLLPAGWDLERFAALVERASRREYPRLPTGVGVCLYVKRQVLRRVGLFDEAFGLGYGEETDFCMRAAAAGWAHVLDDATFVYHLGQASFGAARAGRVAAAERRMRRRHPGYLPAVARFLRADPVRPQRERVLAHLRPPRAATPPRRPRKVVHLVHGWPPFDTAGTELYAAWLVRRQTAWREVAVYSRVAAAERRSGEALELLDAGARVRLVVNHFDQRDPLERNALRNRGLQADWARFLAEEAPDLVHVHHLAGHAAALLRVAAARRVPLVLQLQDWWPLCARANLLDWRRRLCSGPGAGKCSRCLPLTGVPPAPLLNRLLHLYRRRLLRRLVRAADVCVTGSRLLARSCVELGLLPSLERVRVLEYGVELEPAPRPERPRLPLRFGVMGALMPHKGAHVAVAAFRSVDPAHARLTVWGDRAAHPEYARELEALSGPAVELASRFPETEKARLLAGLDVLIVPSLGLESFGLAAREALRAGVPVLAADRGALREIFARGGEPAGGLFDPEQPAALRRWVERLVAEPDLLPRWRRAIPPVVSADEHAEAIERVYEEALARRDGADGARR
jgi:glycosyltransferase involved in cell wall biosynthesis